MKKTIRPTYPKEVSIGFMILTFIIVFILSHQVFNTPFSELDETKGIYLGMFLVASSVIIMILIIWEEFLFPIKVRQGEDGKGRVFSNHSTKLKTQMLIYLLIPAIYIFIYFEYDINLLRFIIWAGICTVVPVVEKIASGINNYNDFLRLTDEEIEYKNNEKEGVFQTKDLKHIQLLKDEGDVLEKIKLIFHDDKEVTIDLDEMELEEFYGYMYHYMKKHYKHLLK